MNEDAEMELAIGGAGGVYFLASPGELVVDVEKRDRNTRNRETVLRAVLVGPDRQVVDEKTIPDDGRPTGSGMGPVQRVRLSAQVVRKGIYGLNITVSQDRYGEEAVWGFRTNCPHYLIETSRGHRDARHEEPIVLGNPGRPGDVCFVPRRGAFEMTVAGLPEGVDALPVYDAEGGLVHTLEVDAEGRASHSFPAGIHRDTVPWRLHLPVQQATVQIEGVTRWDEEDLYPDLSYWTPDPASYFPFQAYRWMLTPYSRTVYGGAEREGEMAFQVHNNSDRTQAFGLVVEFSGDAWPVQMSEERVEVGPKEVKEVRARYTSGPDGETRTCHVRVTPEANPEVTTYSTLIVKAGAAPAKAPLDMPLRLRAYRHENEQFGYIPDFPVEGQVYFDLENRSFLSTGGRLETLRGGWSETCDPQGAVRSRVPGVEDRAFSLTSAKVAFDADNDMYLLASAGPHRALLHSADGGSTFTAYPVDRSDDRRSSLDIETFSGHNVPDGPPPLLRSIQTATDEKLFWRRIATLELFLPEKGEGQIVAGDPIHISDKGLRGCVDVVSWGSKVHVIWAEATGPDEDVPGVPTYVASCDRATRKLGAPALIGYGAPPNDVHNKPSITMDSQGYLHGLAGTHGQPFQHARSLASNDAHSGWTPAVAVGNRQTYIGLVCGPDGTLHLVFRMWRHGEEPFPASMHATLAYQRKRPGMPWEEPRVLIVAPFSEYSIFYHRFVIDRKGRLFLSYDYWSTFWFYRTDHWGRRRSMMMSADGGETWKLVETADFR